MRASVPKTSRTISPLGSESLIITKIQKQPARVFAIQVLLGILRSKSRGEGRPFARLATRFICIPDTTNSSRSFFSNSMGKLCLTCGFSNRWLDAKPDGI
jgi:hypothetical protein